MNLFDQLVLQAMKNKAELAPLRMVVEKELLHHDIIREMSVAGILDTLTFIGGTCLRACYGSNRLSEDLDFTGGKNFNRKTLSDLAAILVDRLEAKYAMKTIFSWIVLSIRIISYYFAIPYHHGAIADNDYAWFCMRQA